MTATILHRPLQMTPISCNIIRGSLERVKPFNQNVRQKEEAFETWIVLVKTADHTAGNELTEDCAGDIDALVNCFGLFPEE